MTKEKPLSASAVARLGGFARKKKLTPEERQAIARQGARALNQQMTAKARSIAARKAVLARWKKYRTAQKKKGIMP